ncbi:DUF6286 domain-containing protein [Streptomyces sp. DSM 44917]|uniref:DUF6286 domain-containing protein n=1 Tax=Streptomyces boetiae TaxID=3075541 RepID=A0ABU2LER3_9ACTN|nr:DUF6286 domain-containing protein [Streptomyces sp. DSM 44917]MDT0310082.1 DUF6286 domain-containing protein [Streptomyces sp. DSM 44917]
MSEQEGAATALGPGEGDRPAEQARASDLAKTTSSAHYEPGRGGGEPAAAGRFWSERRVPAALAAAALLAAAGVLLFDVASVRAERPAAAWRRTLAEELATRDFHDAWVVLCAVAAVLLGLWLVLLALTPGLRGLLPMRRDTDAMRAGVARSAAAAVLRDRALEVSGVRAVRVAVGRRRVRARAEAGFRELDEVRADLDAALERGIGELGLARPVALSVQVRRPPNS